MNLLLDIGICAVIVTVLYLLDVIFFRRKREVQLFVAPGYGRKCDASLSDKSGATQDCHMLSGHTGPHRLHNGDAFSTAKRKAREAQKQSQHPNIAEFEQ